MLALQPSRLLLTLIPILLTLGIVGLFLTGLPFIIKIILSFGLVLFAIFEAFQIMQKWPHSLVAFCIPNHAQNPWVIQFKNGLEFDAKLQNSTRISHKMIFLHFRVHHRKMRVYQIVLPNMIGAENFHDLLVYLKTA